MYVWGFTAPPTLRYVTLRYIIWAPRDLYSACFHRQSRTAPAFLTQLGVTAGSQRKAAITNLLSAGIEPTPIRSAIEQKIQGRGNGGMPQIIVLIAKN